MPADEERLSKPVPARRLILQNLRTGWAIVVDRLIPLMIVPAHHELPKLGTDATVTGTWIEVFGADGVVLYRRRVEFPDTIESFGSKDTPTREVLPARAPPELMVIVPDLPEAVGLALFHAPPPDRLEGRSALRRDLIPAAVFAWPTRRSNRPASMPGPITMQPS